MGPGLFGDMFDFDKNGEMDFIEQSAEIAFVAMMEKELLNENLEQNGIEPSCFANMTQQEREDALAEAGLNCNEYEDYDFI